MEVYLFLEREAVDIRAFKGDYIFSERFGNSAHYTSVEGIGRGTIVHKAVDKAMDKTGKTSAERDNNSTLTKHFLNRNRKGTKPLLMAFSLWGH